MRLLKMIDESSSDFNREIDKARKKLYNFYKHTKSIREGKNFKAKENFEILKAHLNNDRFSEQCYMETHIKNLINENFNALNEYTNKINSIRDFEKCQICGKEGDF